MSIKYELHAEARTGAGTPESRRLRRAGRVPAVVYGGHVDNANITLAHDLMIRYVGQEAFRTALIDILLDGKSTQTILRDVQMHPWRQQVLHMDFQRVTATEAITLAVPLHFVGGDECPGVKLEDGILSHPLTEVEVTCLPGDLPEYIEVDCSALHLHDSVHLSELKMPEGVTLTTFTHGGEDQTVVTVTAPRVTSEDEAEDEAAEAASEAADEADDDKTEDEKADDES